MKKLITAALISLSAFSASADELLVHGLSWHVRSGWTENGVYNEYNNYNVGLGYATSSGWLVGAYYNSYRKMSVYFGKTWLWEVGPELFGRRPELGFSIIGATGYGHRSGSPITPLAGFSGKLPAGDKWSVILTVAPVPYEEDDGSRFLGVVGNMSLSYRF